MLVSSDANAIAELRERLVFVPHFHLQPTLKHRNVGRMEAVNIYFWCIEEGRVWRASICTRCLRGFSWNFAVWVCAADECLEPVKYPSTRCRSFIRRCLHLVMISKQHDKCDSVPLPVHVIKSWSSSSRPHRRPELHGQTSLQSSANCSFSMFVSQRRFAWILSVCFSSVNTQINTAAC